MADIRTIMHTPFERPSFREKKEKNPDHDNPEVEILATNIHIIPEALEYYLQGKEDAVVEVKIKGAKKGISFDPELDPLIAAVAGDATVEDGIIRIIIRKNTKPADFSDRFHTDGMDIYLWTNMLPTEIVKNSKTTYAANVSGASGYLTVDPGPSDIWTPPANALVKVGGGIIHRRPIAAATQPGRYSLRISIER